MHPKSYALIAFILIAWLHGAMHILSTVYATWGICMIACVCYIITIVLAAMNTNIAINENMDMERWTGGWEETHVCEDIDANAALI